jgi:hypothetical protein
MRTQTLLTAVLICLPAFAQDNKEHSTATPYQVEYIIHDASDPSAKNGRHYILQLDNMNTRANIRSGAKAPYATSTAPNGVGTQWNYADIGVNIECRLYERDGHLMMTSNFEINSLAPNSQNAPAPAISQVRTETGTVVALGKQMALLTIDDPQMPKKLRVIAVVTPVP